MAKKITRGITGIKEINKQDFDTNNVNDLLSDGQYNYIHRKKGKSEEYHNLTDNIKTISSDNTDLLTVTNNNKTNNTALLSPKHDAQKEQVLESERNTVSIRHATNATPEKTKVDTNPAKVLEHDNLFTGYGISKTKTGNTTKLGVEYTKVEDGFDLNNLENGRVRAENFVNAPKSNRWFFVSSYTEGSFTIQRAIELDNVNNTGYVRLKREGTWRQWREQVGDKSVIDATINKLTTKLTALEEKLNSLGQNTENYYICFGDVSGTMTLTKFENDIITQHDRVKGVLEYSLYLYYDAGSQAHVEKTITGTIKNIADGGNGEDGIYTDVTNPTIFSNLYDLYPTGGSTEPNHDSGAFIFYHNGDGLSVTCDTTKAPGGKVYNITGKTLLIEKVEHGGGGGGSEL